MKKVRTGLIGIALIAALAACQKEEGPMEKAGKAVDQTAEKIGDAVKPEGSAEKAGESVDKALSKAGEAIKSGVETAGEKLEQAGDKIKQSASSESKN